MSILAGMSVPTSKAQVIEKFNSFVGKVTTDSTANIAASIGVALVALTHFDYLPSALMGTVVCLLAENCRINDKAEKVEEQNRTLMKANAFVTARLESRPDSKLPQTVLSLKQELREANENIQKLGNFSKTQHRSLQNCHDLIRALNAQNQSLESLIASSQVEGNPATLTTNELENSGAEVAQ